MSSVMLDDIESKDKKDSSKDEEEQKLLGNYAFNDMQMSELEKKVLALDEKEYLYEARMNPSDYVRFWDMHIDPKVLQIYPEAKSRYKHICENRDKLVKEADRRNEILEEQSKTFLAALVTASFGIIISILSMRYDNWESTSIISEIAKIGGYVSLIVLGFNKYIATKLSYESFQQLVKNECGKMVTFERWYRNLRSSIADTIITACNALNITQKGDYNRIVMSLKELDIEYYEEKDYIWGYFDISSADIGQTQCESTDRFWKDAETVIPSSAVVLAMTYRPSMNCYFSKYAFTFPKKFADKDAITVIKMIK